MLPVVVCEEDRALRARWLSALEALARQRYPLLRYEALPGGTRELTRALEAESGIMLVILAVTEAAEESVRLFASVMERNRDNYVLLCLHDAARLNAVLSRCMRPAGILLSPFDEDGMLASLDRVLRDYTALYAEESRESYMTVTSGKTLRRIAYRDIEYFEAQDKLLNICTRRYVASVRASLNAVEKELPPQFIRCHRSYIVNRACVERLDMPAMTLYLSSGERLPVSRSCKEALREGLRAEGKA